MAIYTADFAIHPKTVPNEVDQISFDLGGLGIHEYPVHVKVVNCSTTPGEAIYFDFNYPGQVKPSAAIAPGAPNTFVVLPGQVWEMTPGAQVATDFVVVSAFAVPYSVMVYV